MYAAYVVYVRVWQAKFRRYELDIAHLTEQAQKQAAKGKDGPTLRKPFTVVAALRARVDAPSAPGGEGEAVLLRQAVAALQTKVAALTHEVSEGQRTVATLTDKLQVGDNLIFVPAVVYM